MRPESSYEDYSGFRDMFENCDLSDDSHHLEMNCWSDKSNTGQLINKQQPIEVTETDNGTHPSFPPTAPKQTACGVTLNMLSERDRLKTFNRWPCDFMNPKDLAAAGFYYYNCEDYVRCVFCNIEVGRWERGDNPMSDHQRWSSSCPFVRGEPVGNITMDDTPTDTDDEVTPPRASEDTCGRFGIQLRPHAVAEKSGGGSINLTKLGITPNKNPVYPMYSTEEARLNTFAEWPRSMKQKPDELAEAGFFYTGKGDQTMCFSCGGGLKDWIETDDPWEQHAKWFSKCSFVLLVKGNAYVRDVCNRLDAALVTPEQAANLESSAPQQGTSTQADPIAPPPPQVPKKSLDDGRLCKICYTEELGVLFLPCSHIVACVKCAPSLTTCAVCRQPFTATVRAYLS